MSIEPDDLRSHRTLGADLMKMENEKQRLALYPDLVKMLQRIEDRLWEQQSITDLQFQIAVLLDRARAIK